MGSAGVKWLFLDMNSYFASVEQELRPELRERPIAVVAVMTEGTCCIAASYEAKKQGVKTGTSVKKALSLCPDLELVESRPAIYIKVHNEIVSVVKDVVPINEVHSIDEMSCVLLGRERNPLNALAIARDIKQAIRTGVGAHLHCSVGLGPNRFLAKVASNLKKPDGLTIITPDNIASALRPLSLSDLPGIGPAMVKRLGLRSINTVEQLGALSKDQIFDVWGSVLGKRWWHLLRGHDIEDPPTQRRTVGHSHVLAPEMRTQSKTRSVLIKLIHKAATRLRRLGYWAGRLGVQISYFDRHHTWERSVKLGRCQDTQTMIEAFSVLWQQRPPNGTPLRAAVTLYDLTPAPDTTPPLLPKEQKRNTLAHTLDKINERYGSDCIYFGSMYEGKQSAPMRISFTSIPDLIAEGTARERSLANSKNNKQP